MLWPESLKWTWKIIKVTSTFQLFTYHFFLMNGPELCMQQVFFCKWFFSRKKTYSGKLIKGLELYIPVNFRTHHVMTGESTEDMLAQNVTIIYGNGVESWSLHSLTCLFFSGLNEERKVRNEMTDWTMQLLLNIPQNKNCKKKEQKNDYSSNLIWLFLSFCLSFSLSLDSFWFLCVLFILLFGDEWRIFSF